MNKVLLFLVLFFSVFLTDKSFAQIVVNKTSGCAPLTQVQFSFGLVGQWDFGDLASATGDNVSHSFSNPGTYNVTFSQGGTILDQISIQVFSNPTPAFNLNGAASGCIPHNTSFTDASTGGGGTNIVSWNWAFGDGGGSSQPNPNYTYSLLGTYSVSLIVVDQNGCDSSVTKANLITTTNAPTASFTTNPSPARSCTAPLTVNFTNNSTNSTGGTTNLSYDWDFGNGSTSTDQNPPPVLYNAVGVYTVRLTVTQAGGCSRSTTRTVTIGSPNALPNVPDTICFNSTQVLGNNSTGATSYIWTLSTGQTYSSVTPNHTFSTAGNINITLQANAAGCSDDTTFSVYVERVIADFTRNPTYDCQDPYCFAFSGSANITNVKSWDWTFGDNQASRAKDTSYCYQINDMPYYVHKPYYMSSNLLVVSTNGCNNSISKTDTIFPVSAFFFPDNSEGCAPLTVDFSDSTRSREGIVSWQYSFGDGTTSTTQDPTHVFNNPGEYEVTLIAVNSFGCRDTSYPVTIKVGTPIALNFSISDASICVGESVDFTDLTNDPNIDYIHFSTNSNYSADCINGSTHTFSGFDEVGMQDVTMSAYYNGCISNSTQANAIEVKGPKGEVRYNALCSAPLKYDFDGTIQGANTWHWDFGDGTILMNSVDSNPSHTYAASGDYTVRLITVNNSSGCSNDTAVLAVNVRQISAVITGDVSICEGVGYSYSAATSTDVYGNCENAYRWDLGNQTAPRLRDSPTISFSFPDSGAYTVRLITTDINGCKDTATHDVKVNRIEAEIGADKFRGCLPLAINLSDSSVSDTTITQWFWSLNGVAYSNAKDTAVNFTTSGNRTAQLIVQDALGCRDTASVTLIPILPDTNFSATTNRNICFGDSVRFAPNNPNSLATTNWTFGSVLGTSTTKTPYFTFNAAGNFAVKLDVVDTNGCPGSRTINNYVYVENIPVAGFSTNFDTTSVICYPVAVVYNDTSIANIFVSRTWDLGTGNPIVPNQQVTWNYETPGTYNLSLIVRTQNGCRDTAERTIEIVGPIADFDMSRNLICSGEEVVFTIKDTNDVETYEWDFGDGFLATEGSPVSHVYNDVPTSLQTIVQLIAYSEDSVCTATKSYPLNFQQVAARFGLSDTVICLNETLTVSDSSLGATSYQWTVSNGPSSTAANLSPVTFSGSGLQTVQLVIQNNLISCKDTLVKEVLVNPIPSIDAENGAFCEGDTVKLLASTPNSALVYAWTPSTGIDEPDSLNTFIFFDESSSYTITVTDTNQCRNADVAEIYIQKSYDPITVDTCVVIGENIPLGRDLGTGYTYTWSGSEADLSWLSCLDCPTQTIKITEEVDEVNYTLIYADSLGCFENEIKYKICIIPSYTFDVPSAFTPDGDGINDIVYLRGHGIKSVVEFKIFNRWGELIFESNELTQGWDGTYKVREQNMEMYIYKATVEFYNGKQESKGGSITLIR